MSRRIPRSGPKNFALPSAPVISRCSATLDLNMTGMRVGEGLIRVVGESLILPFPFSFSASSFSASSFSFFGFFRFFFFFFLGWDQLGQFVGSDCQLGRSISNEAH